MKLLQESNAYTAKRKKSKRKQINFSLFFLFANYYEILSFFSLLFQRWWCMDMRIINCYNLNEDYNLNDQYFEGAEQIKKNQEMVEQK